MVSQIPPEEQLRKMTHELEEFSGNLRYKLDSVKEQDIKVEKRKPFFSQDRRDFWHMPGWLWVSIVCFLVGIFILALYTAYM